MVGRGNMGKSGGTSPQKDINMVKRKSLLKKMITEKVTDKEDPPLSGQGILDILARGLVGGGESENEDQIDPATGKKVEGKEILGKLGNFIEKVQMRRALAVENVTDRDGTIKIRRKWYIFYSDSKSKSIWDSISSILILYVLIVIPYRLAFVDDADEQMFTIINWCIDIFFMLDIVINFFCATQDKDENIVDDLKEIAIQYTKFWFWLD